MIITMLTDFPAGSSAGLSAISPGLLLSSTRHKSDNFNVAQGLANIISWITNGNAPVQFASWIIGGRLIPIGLDKLRPIVVVDVLGRLSGKVIAEPIIKESATLFPNQGGIGEKNTVERTALLVQNAISKSKRLDLAVLAIDFRNGFGELNRLAIFAHLFNNNKLHLARYFQWCYGTNLNLVLSNGHRVTSEIGVIQGDPIAPIAFCIVMQQVINFIIAGEFDIIRGHLDDLTLVGPAGTLINIVDSIDCPAVKASGLHINLLKSRMYFPGQGIDTVEELRTKFNIPDSIVVSNNGVITLGIPIGDELFTQSHLFNVVLPELHKINNDLATLKCSQAELFLWTSCGGVSRVNHMLHSVNPSSTAAFCVEVDAISESVLKRCLHMDLISASNLAQAQLPKSSGGLALTSASSISTAAFLSAVHAINSDPMLLQQQQRPSIIVNAHVKPALLQLNQLVHDRNKIKDVKAFRNAKLGLQSQKDFTVICHDQLYDYSVQ
jgi:hypothetical protein